LLFLAKKSIKRFSLILKNKSKRERGTVGKGRKRRECGRERGIFVW
jgi:hypothetical protein